MRITFTFTFILILIYNLVLSQDKSVQDSQRKINQSIDRILLLNNLDGIASGIYTNSLSWVYLITDQTSKRKLREQIIFELPKIKEQMSAANLGSEFSDRFSSLMSSVDDLASVAKVMMKELMVFEDYVDDSTEFDSENYKIWKRRMDQEILPRYQSIDAAIEKEISSEEKQLAAILSEARSVHLKPQIDWSLIEYRYKILADKFKLRKLNSQILSGGISWVYRRYDSLSKEQLVKSIDVDSKELQSKLIENSESWDIKDQLMTEFLINSLDTIVVHLRMSIIETLNTEADYDDGMILLLAEDEIQNGIIPRFLFIQSLIEENLTSEVERMKNSISELSGEKNSDVRKMLQYNYSTLKLVINEANKSNPQFSLDDLIDAIIPVYSKRFTHEEIKEILKFQNSKVGKKMHKNSESILLETIEATSNYYKSIPTKKN
jgi:hypothetical protein